MARLLYETDSADKHLSSARLHTRRCALVPNTGKYVDAIDPFYTDLQAKSSERGLKRVAREDAYDEVVFYDSVMDNEVKNLFRDSVKYDSKHPGELVEKKLFPKGKFTVITDINREDEQDAVDALILRVETLGAEHELYPYAALLNEKLTQCRNSTNTLKEKQSEENLAKANEDISKETLRRQYEKNYLDARADLGRNLAERLFPKNPRKKE